MKAALDLMWEESYGAVTIDDICKRAGCEEGEFLLFLRVEGGTRRRRAREDVER